MEDRGAGADERGREQQQRVAAREGEQHQPDEREAHAGGERIRARLAVRVGADERLQQRGGDLEGEGEQADLPEAER